MRAGAPHVGRQRSALVEGKQGEKGLPSRIPRHAHIPCITQLKAQGPSKTCDESKEEEEDLVRGVHDTRLVGLVGGLREQLRRPPPPPHQTHNSNRGQEAQRHSSNLPVGALRQPSAVSPPAAPASVGAVRQPSVVSPHSLRVVSQRFEKPVLLSQCCSPCLHQTNQPTPPKTAHLSEHPRPSQNTERQNSGHHHQYSAWHGPVGAPCSAS